MTAVANQRIPTSWTPTALEAALAGHRTLGPSILSRTDGQALLYPGRTHWFQGESESLKSWGAQFAVADVLNRGGAVLYVDFEDEVHAVVERLLALRVDRARIADGLTYVRPDEPLRDRHGAFTSAALDLADLLAAGPYDLAVIDGVTEAMTCEGLDLLSNADVARWMRRVPRAIAETTGAAVVCIDHVTKSADARGRYAIGGQHKLAGVDGAAYTFSLVRPLARATHTAVEAAVAIHVVKDRPGHVRGATVDGKVGVLELTAYPDGGVTARLEAPNGSTAPDHHLVVAVLEYLSVYDGSSGRQVTEGIGGKAERVRAALAWCADPERAWVLVEPKGRSHLHWLTDAGRAQIAEGDA